VRRLLPAVLLLAACGTPAQTLEVGDGGHHRLGKAVAERSWAASNHVTLEHAHRVHAEKEAHAASVKRRRQTFRDTPPLSTPVESGGNRALGQSLMLSRFGADQWPCLDALWAAESGWNHLARNRRSGAYGIPQALPGYKMASHGADWEMNPATQISWGLAYIAGRFETPCAAYDHFRRRGWY
jgi:hypothetical protein